MLEIMDIIEIDLDDRDAVCKLIATLKIPIDPAVGLRVRDNLIIAHRSKLKMVVDPYTGEPIDLSEVMQTYVSDQPNPFHVIGLNGQTLVDKTSGAVLELVEYVNAVWYGALVDLTFS
jgi:hypothetical protein